MISFEQIKTNEEINLYIKKADDLLSAIGFTEHSFAHVGKVVDVASYILTTLGYSERDIEVVKIAAYMHDIGNLVNRVEHAQSGAVMAFNILSRLGASPDVIADVATAIGNHDESTAVPVNPITAALIIADKTDVRRNRVRNADSYDTTDIHDRVNYSVKKSLVKINEDKTKIKLKLTIDPKVCAVMDYFEIFLERMNLCRDAAKVLGLQFHLIINEQQIL